MCVLNRGINIDDHLLHITPLTFMMFVTIMIGQLGLVKFTRKKTERKNIKKLIYRPFNKKINNGLLISLFTSFLLSFLLINYTSPNWQIIIVTPFIQNCRSNLVLMVLYVFIPLLCFDGLYVERIVCQILMNHSPIQIVG